MMSCGNPAADTDALMPRRKKYDKTKQCIKCKVVDGNIVVRHAVYCKECFFPLISYKFRRSLEHSVNPIPDGPRRTALKPAGNLLVGLSGGLGSTVLLDLVHKRYVSMDQSAMLADGGTNHPRRERVWKKVTACYVEICDAFPGMEDHTAELNRVVSQYDGIEFVALRIQNAFDHKWWEEATGSPDPIDLGVMLTDEELPLTPLMTSSSRTPLDSLRSFLASLPTATAVSSTIQTLIRLLLQYTALKLESSHLVLGTSLTGLAVSLISGISQGRGFNLKEEMQEEWVPSQNIDIRARLINCDALNDEETGSDGNVKTKVRSVRVVRPLRDIGRKECALWAWWKGLNIAGKASWPWTGSRHDIGALTKDFIVGLEKDYPSTVSAIVRTCTKVAPKGAVAGQCILCAHPIQDGVQGWKSHTSIRSRVPVSTAAVSSNVTSVKLALTSYICYACHTTLTSKSTRPTPLIDPSFAKPSAVVLPVWAGPQLRELGEVIRRFRVDEEDMKSAIEDFLLDE